MNKYYIFLLALMTGFLTACGPIYQTQYSYVPPRSPMGNMCLAQCIQGKSMCEQMSQMRSDSCRMQSRQDAMFRYQVYRDGQIARGQPIHRRPNDFDYGSFGCNSSGDTCTHNFNMCYQSCGGQVMAQQVCTAFCNR
jgi:hypothetical protein